MISAADSARLPASIRVNRPAVQGWSILERRRSQRCAPHLHPPDMAEKGPQAPAPSTTTRALVPAGPSCPISGRIN